LPPALALALAGAALMAGAPAAQAKIAILHFTAYYYSAKIGVKGGAHQDASYPPGVQGTVVEEHAQASYSIDESFPGVILVASGRIPGAGNPTRSTSPMAVVNGTWSNQGTTWDELSRTTVPYSCNGTISQQYGAAPQLRWSVTGSAFRFTAYVLLDPLTVLGQQACPGNAFYLSEVDTPAYQTTFSIPKRNVGKRTIVVNISGPLAAHRPPAADCSYSATGTCAFSTAWQGVIRLTRTRTLKF
jgi:hypothetical protein